MIATLRAFALLVSFCALAPPAWADVAGPEPVDVSTLCAPGDDEGDSCTTDDGEEGSCSDSTESCYDPAKASYTTCRVCEEDGCAVAPGPKPGGGSAALVGIGALGLAVLLGRRTVSRRPRPR